MASQNSNEHVVPLTTEVVLLNCKEAFEGLKSQEKLYCHYLSQASFYGGLIVLYQTSSESLAIFVLLQKLFKAESPDEIEKVSKSVGYSDEDVQALFVYAAAFYCNMGNYKSFGDIKFVPSIPQGKFKSLINASKAYANERDQIDMIWESVKDSMYSLTPKAKELGLGDKGTSTYYSVNCDETDAKIGQSFMDSKNISPYNTRLFKSQDLSSGKTIYEIRLASALASNDSVPGYPDGQILGDYSFTPEGQTEAVNFKVTRGDYSSLMNHVVEELESAKNHAANDLERNMLTEYIKSFKTGSLPAHKDGSRFWIANKGPVVETYIGFIESYRDPFGVRGEFEGFVAVVNRMMSAKFAELVNQAEKFLAHLPWPVEYEKDTFLRPDFTSLDVLSFGGSGIPAGINIPNYDDIRQSEGFKNVALGNVLTSSYKDSKPTFLCATDIEVYSKYKIPSFEVQVGLHELLGHGSGKLFMEDSDGKLNFDQKSTFYPETTTPINSWYKHGETWDSKFSSLGSTYEECRAECVGIYLCLISDVLRIFGHSGDQADDIIYVNWLNMVRAGLMALEFYSPASESWKQAHMNARFVILRVLLEAGDGLISVEKFEGDDGKPDLKICLERSKINSVGKKAIGNFLKKLQVYKSTADYSTASKMYQAYSKVTDHDPPHFLSLRRIVLDRKQPRKLFVQHHTYLEGNEVKLKSYDPSPKGVIQSFVDRFPSSELDTSLLSMWNEERPFHQA